MKLNKKDKEMLIRANCSESDFFQMEEASKKTNFFLLKNDSIKKQITKTQALEILGRELFWSGIARSAFHWTAVRESINGTIYFDSSSFFRKGA